MNFLLNILEHTKRELFAPGKPLNKMYYAFDAADTFLFSPSHVTHGGPHVRDQIDTKRFMSMVILALIPPLLLGIYNAGFQSLKATGGSTDLLNCVLHGLYWAVPLILISYAVGGTVEMIFSVVRKHPINEGFLVTGLLFPLVLPPTLPWWQAVVGIIFGVVIGKEVFGGTGMNILNPALVARAFCFFAYPGKMSGDNVWVGLDSTSKTIDGYTGATALGYAMTMKGTGANIHGGSAVEMLEKSGRTWWDMFVGFEPGSIGETSALACLIGAVILILAGVGSYRTMFGTVLGAGFMCFVFNSMYASHPDTLSSLFSLPLHYHLVMGGFAFGAVYMATDPVSSAATKWGKWIYGFCIGALCIIIRVVNPAYPEGMMLAILFMNIFAPLIDYYVVRANTASRRARYAQ